MQIKTLYQIPNYTLIHLKRNGLHKGGSVDLFVHTGHHTVMENYLKMNIKV